MKRSQINALVEKSMDFMLGNSFYLPEWAYWDRERWLKEAESCSRIFELQLGWDLTDFGSGNFNQRGLILFTLRNGIPGSGGKGYAEKIMIVGRKQETPYHFHWHKREDIINRGGGRLVFQLHGSTVAEELSDKPFDIYIDERKYRIGAGEYVELSPGQSLCLERGVYHRFFAEDGDVLCGEVSDVNDDVNDNRFLDAPGRFPDIEEDEAIRHLLVGDYAGLEGGSL
ncbi:MAG: D-lyxose/D-mannose family sugar isomerase [Spirochaetales bacterium]|nr:D-lyxose/D-mannose family sugar isomerase [Spirochaetales bacterium]